MFLSDAPSRIAGEASRFPRANRISDVPAHIRPAAGRQMRALDVQLQHDGLHVCQLNR